MSKYEGAAPSMHSQNKLRLALPIRFAETHSGMHSRRLPDWNRSTDAFETDRRIVFEEKMNALIDKCQVPLFEDGEGNCIAFHPPGAAFCAVQTLRRPAQFPRRRVPPRIRQGFVARLRAGVVVRQIAFRPGRASEEVFSPR